MKFVASKIEVGDIVTVAGSDGLSTKFRVQYNFHTRNSECVIGLVYAGHGTPDAPEPFSMTNDGVQYNFHTEHRQIYWFPADGHYGGPADAKITKIKKEWKNHDPSVLAVELEVGMRVRIKQDGKWIRGTVERAHDSPNLIYVAFGAPITLPNGEVRDRTSLVYSKFGKFNWHDDGDADQDHRVRKLRIRQYRAG